MSRSYAYDDVDDDLRRGRRDAILRRAMAPGGVDTWARIDRVIPGGNHGWVIVPHERGGYQPDAMAVRDATIVEALRRIQGPNTLKDLNCTPEFIDQVDAVLGYVDTSIFDFEPDVAARIVQIGLFGSIWYPAVEPDSEAT